MLCRISDTDTNQSASGIVLASEPDGFPCGRRTEMVAELCDSAELPTEKPISVKAAGKTVEIKNGKFMKKYIK